MRLLLAVLIVMVVIVSCNTVSIYENPLIVEEISHQGRIAHDDKKFTKLPGSAINVNDQFVLLPERVWHISG